MEQLLTRLNHTFIQSNWKTAIESALEMGSFRDSTAIDNANPASLLLAASPVQDSWIRLYRASLFKAGLRHWLTFFLFFKLGAKDMFFRRFCFAFCFPSFLSFVRNRSKQLLLRSWWVRLVRGIIFCFRKNSEWTRQKPIFSQAWFEIAISSSRRVRLSLWNGRISHTRINPTFGSREAKERSESALAPLLEEEGLAFYWIHWRKDY